MNKYRSEETAQAKNKNLDYLSDLKFRNINRLIEFSLKNGNDDRTRYYFEKFYVSLVEIKNENLWYFWCHINEKNFHVQAIDSNIKRYDETRKLTIKKSEDYTNRGLLGYYSIKKHKRIIAVDLARQKELHADLKAIKQTEFVGQAKKSRLLNYCYQSIFVLTT